MQLKQTRGVTPQIPLLLPAPLQLAEHKHITHPNILLNHAVLPACYQGTPCYCGPEVRSHGKLFLSSDAFSFGVMLWYVSFMLGQCNASVFEALICAFAFAPILSHPILYSLVSYSGRVAIPPKEDHETEQAMQAAFLIRSFIIVA